MKKILMTLLLILPFCISACSCDRFSLKTYTDAVNHYENSVGLEYTLNKSTLVTDKNIEVQEEGTYMYTFTPLKKVIDFSSVIKKYEIELKTDGTNGNPNKVFEIDRYYKGEEKKFYSKDGITDKRNVENISYEEKYDENSEYHISNLVPTFDNDFISNFKITKHESLKKYSVATFTAACPVTSECDEDLEIVYTVTMDSDYYFSKIEFTTIKTLKKAVEATEDTPAVAAVVKTVKYTYEFKNFNDDVKITFPNDLVNY